MATLPTFCRWLMILAVTALITSCGTYHKVAVWYKYRRDFHRPKQQSGLARTANPETAQKHRQDETAGYAPIAFRLVDQQNRTEEWKDIPRRRVQIAQPSQEISASIASTHPTRRTPVWAHADSSPHEEIPPPARHPFHKGAMWAFALMLLALSSIGLAFIAPYFLFFTILLIPAGILAFLSIKPITEHKYRGFGFAISVLILDAMVGMFAAFFLWLIVIVLLTGPHKDTDP